MRAMRKGRWLVRPAESTDDLRAAQRLRWLCFVGARDAGAAPSCEYAGPPASASAAESLDADALDAVCTHVLIEDTRSGHLVACFRLLDLASGADIGRSYSAQYYNLAALSHPERVFLGLALVHRYKNSRAGSSMAPLFTNLSLWIAGFVLMVLFKLEVDTEDVEHRPHAARMLHGCR